MGKKPKMNSILTSFVKWALPVERQGMSGADAEHDSMRDVKERVLSMQVTVLQQATFSLTQPPQELRPLKIFTQLSLKRVYQDSA